MTNGLRAILAAFIFTASTVAHVLPLLVAAILKALLPVRPIRRVLDRLLMLIAASWIGVNSWMIRALTHTHITLELPAMLRPDARYLVFANHQSWVDIPMLQLAFNRRIPLLRFFLKSVLFWVPLLGLAWWALDFPFMKRYSRELLAKRPELAGRDMAATRRACEKFRELPVSIMNFVEGTRFTPVKHAKQDSPYTYLLKPKAGGVGFVLDAMGEALDAVLDVTIVYPHGRPSFADLFANRVPEVRISVAERPIPPELIGKDSERDVQQRARVQQWINAVWSEKDAVIARAMAHNAATSARSG